MKKLILKAFFIVVFLIAVVAIAGFIKFNFLDVPYMGDSVGYKAETGETIVISKRVDESIQLSTPNIPRAILQPVKSDSGVKYSNAPESLIFWRKGKEFVIEESGEMTYRGKEMEQ